MKDRNGAPMRLLAAVVLVALAAAGCTGRGEAASAKGTPSPEDREEAILAFTECMREHGIDMPDPETSDDGRPGLRITRDEGANEKVDREELEAARKACEKHLEGTFQQFSPEQRAEMQDRMVRFAECMRDHGIDMPDPDFSESGGRVRAFQAGPGGGIDPDDPDFKKADEACRDEVFDGQGGPGGMLFFGPGRRGG
jgi:hypothetical protein